SGKPYRQGMVFRCKPDGSDFEVLGHNFRNNYEVAVDSFGTLWQSDNDDDGNKGVRINWVMEYGNYGYVDELTGAGWRAPRTNLEAEVPQQHWHLNDPGVVPNLLMTGGGSPCGICVYEGGLLPARFRGSLVHCDPGPNVVRAYHVKPAGAGYAATAETIIDGSADRWFRPSDVCVAPDGSLIVADWHDPGVGGHGMGDTEKGRLYRIAPKGSAWSVPTARFGTVADCLAALASPNLCTRALALEGLAKQPQEAATALAAAFASASDAVVKARFAWAAGMLPGQAEAWIARLASDADERFRIIALRMCRLTKGDVLALVEKLLADPAAAVRRECAIALKAKAGGRADRAWAELAAQHKAGDRWELEALGIGADGQWDGRLEAWLAKTSGPKNVVDREIVWRSRGAKSSTLIGLLLGSPDVGTSESLALLRSFDFQEQRRVSEVVRDLLAGGLSAVADEKLRVILPELVLRLAPGDAADPVLAKRIDEAAGYVAGTQRFVELVQRFGLKDRFGDLVTLATDPGTAEQLAAAAAGGLMDGGGEDRVKAALAGDPAAAARLLAALGIRGSGSSITLLKRVLADAAAAPELKAAAVRGLGRSQQGAKDLVAMAKAGELSGVLPQVAAVAIASCPWGDIRQAAADVLPMPKAKGGEKLPPVSELVKRKGDPAVGKTVFAGAGTCAKCHVVDGAGKAVGPNLSGVGAKLSRESLYESVLAPSAAISHSYETYTAILEDGRSVTGLLVSQSPDQVVIRGVDSIDVTLPAGELDELVKQPVSLMPADL
ncbi:MAG: PVC-type heme-binding CxxCH protein, partial [Planctomycetia bacterium]